MQLKNRRGLAIHVVATLALMCSACRQQSTVNVEKRLFGDMTPTDREQIEEVMKKAGYEGSIVSIEPKSDHWIVDFNIVQVGKDGKKRRATPKPPDSFKVSKSGKVTKL